MSLPPAAMSLSLPRSKVATTPSSAKKRASLARNACASRPPPGWAPVPRAAGIGVVSASATSSGVILRMIGPSSIRTGRGGCVRTILPASLPRYFAKSASEAICTRTTSAVTSPFVPGDHSWRSDERLRLRLDEVGGELHERPALAEFPPLLMDVGQAPLGELLHRPLA